MCWFKRKRPGNPATAYEGSVFAIPPLLQPPCPRRPQYGVGGGGEKVFFDTRGDNFFGGDPPRGRGGGLRKKRVLHKKLFLPMSHIPHIITVFPPHNMPLALIGICLFGYLGY